MLKEIEKQLALVTETGAFATRRTVPVEDLNLEVRGVGRIRLPASTTAARKLCAVARPARHGYKDQTRLDPGVRDTWEIAKSRISIDARMWKKTLAPQLERIRRDLGLPEECRLEAELHNLLIYAPGQFFVTHQDSEKKDDMIGTLVVNLPSKFSGGATVIEHHEEKLVSRGSDKNLTFIAFYADCRHEVRPIKQGYRIALTYNLIVKDRAAMPAYVPGDRVDALARRIRDFFETSPPRRWSGDSRAPPDRLVYLLDHQYTQRGLAWNRLKNVDAARARALQDVARQLDCEIVLALADVHETWACEEEYYGHGRRWSWGYDDDDEDDDAGDDSERELIELISDEVELRHWIAPGGRPAAMHSNVGDDELCYTKPSDDFEPFQSEHEGYMGNWGNTVDRWYHRAAVVLWPRERTFVIRSKASARWGLGEGAKKLQAKDVEGARELAERLLPFWAQAARQDAKPGLLAKTVGVAAKLDAPETAAVLLEPFTLTGMTPKLAPRLVDLLDRYGLEWCRALLRQWMSQKHYEAPDARLTWMAAALPALSRALCAATSSGGRNLARWMLAEQWAWLLEDLQALCENVATKELVKESSRLIKPMLAVIESSGITKQADLHRQAVELLATPAPDFPIELPLGVLRAAHGNYRPDALLRLGLRPIHDHYLQELTGRLEAPARAEDDWSIATVVRCSCELCRTLTAYLRGPHEIRLEWPIAEDKRAHIHRVIDHQDLPVRHTTRRKGRPYTLVLEKTDAVFKRALAERLLWQSELEWLTKTSGSY